MLAKYRGFEALLQLIVRYRFKTLIASGAIELFATSPLVDKYDMSSLRSVVYAGKAASEAHVRAAIARLGLDSVYQGEARKTAFVLCKTLA